MNTVNFSNVYTFQSLAEFADVEDGTPSVTWTVTSKPDGALDPTITNSNTTTPSFQFHELGRYVLRATATDSTSQSDFDEVTFIVKDNRQPSGPDIELVNPIDGQVYVRTDSRFKPLRAIITDSETEVVPSSVTFDIYSQTCEYVASIKANESEFSDDEYVAEWVPGKSGLYLLKVSATDTDGDTSIAFGVINIADNPLSAIDGTIAHTISSDYTGDLFGSSVDISGNYAIVGARNHSYGSGAKQGMVYIYERSSTGWSNVQEITLDSLDGSGTAVDNDKFGWSVAIDGQYAAIGAPYRDLNVGGNTYVDPGVVYILKRVDGEWVKVQDPITDPYDATYNNTTNHEFGYALDIEGDTLVIGAPGWSYEGATGANYGRVYVYQLNDEGMWDTQTYARLIPRATPGGNASQEDGARFGESVSLSGDIIAVGSPNRNHDTNGDGEITDGTNGTDDERNNSGEVFIYEKDANLWQMTLRLNVGTSLNAYFGSSVAIDEDTLVVGSKNRERQGKSDAGHAYVYRRVGESWDDAETDKLDSGLWTNPVVDELYGYAVAVQDEFLAVGAPNNDIDQGPTNAGATYLFNQNPNTEVWSPTLIRAESPQNNDRMGLAFAMSGGTILVGSPSLINSVINPHVVFFSLDNPTIAIAQPTDGTSYTHGQTITVRALVADPYIAARSTTPINLELMIDDTDGVLNTGPDPIPMSINPNTGFYEANISSLAQGKHIISLRYSTGEVGSRNYIAQSTDTSIYVYSVDSTEDNDTDDDGIDDAKELLYYGTLDEVDQYSDSGVLSDINSDKDPTVASGDPYIETIYPKVGSTVAAPVTYEYLQDSDTYKGLALTVNVAGLDSEHHTIQILDRNDMDITTLVDINNNGAEIAIKQYYIDGILNDETSKYLSGLTHEYTIKLNNTTQGNTTPEKEYTIYFKVDAELPTVTPSHAGGRISDDSIEVSLEGDQDDIVLIQYQLYGDESWSNYYAVPFEFTSSTVLSFKAFDKAGNEGPTRTVYYAFGDELTPVTGLQAGYDPGDDQIDLTWDVWQPDDSTPIIGYHIYQAISPMDIRRLKTSIEEGYPPPHYLRITNESSAINHEDTAYEINNTDFVPGMTAWYGITVTTADGNESVISKLVEVTTDPADLNEPQIDVEEATDRAVHWLLANQAESGYWGDDTKSRMIATSQALNALGKVPGFVTDHPDVIERALAYLEGHFEDNNDSIARTLDTLQRYDRNTDGLHVKHEFRSLKNTGTSQIMGWGTLQRYYPDPLHTSLGIIARRSYGFRGKSIDDTHTTVTQSELQAIDAEGNANGRYGWVPQNRDSIYVSTYVYRAAGLHHPYAPDLTEPEYKYKWILDEQSDITPGSFRDNILDTAAVLINLPIGGYSEIVNGENIPPVPDDSRDLADAYLISKQEKNGSWENDPFMTALCLEAITKRIAIHYRSDTSTPFWAESSDSIADVLLKRGFQVVSVELAYSGGTTIDPTLLESASIVIVDGRIDTTHYPELGLILRDVNVPVIACNSGVYAGMSLTSPSSNDYGITDTIFKFIANIDLTHPLANGITNLPTRIYVNGPSRSLNWGIPVGPEHQIAYVTDTLDSTQEAVDRTVIFAYDRDDILFDGIRAPARRIGFFLYAQAQTTSVNVGLGDNGRALLNAAIEWATTPVPMP